MKKYIEERDRKLELHQRKQCHRVADLQSVWYTEIYGIYGSNNIE